MKNAAAKQHFSKPTEPLTGNVLYQREVGRETTASLNYNRETGRLYQREVGRETTA